MSRLLACALAIVLLSSCSLGRPGEVQASGAPQATTSKAAGSTPKASHVPAGGVADPDNPPDLPSRDDDKPAATPRARPHDEGSIGANAFLYLNRRVPALVVEVDAVAGLDPPGAVLELLRQRLTEVTDKPGGITFTQTETIPGQADGVWTNDDLRASAIRYRDRYSSAERMVIYLQFVDGRYQAEGAFGVSYSASQAALFAAHIADAATLLVSATALERASLVHEAGHLLSLVNLGYDSPRAREDPEHPNHSTNPDSVMYWAVDNVGILTLLGGQSQPPTAFDAADLADLADVRSGKLP